MKFDLNSYETVDARIKRFYSEHEDGRITTELLSDPNNITTAVVKAYLYVGDELKATGLAYETAGEGYVNKTSHLENCETSAIGRALANWNYSGDKRPSREEMEKTQRQPDIGDAQEKTRSLLKKHEDDLHPEFVAMAEEDISRSKTVEEVRKVYTRIQNKLKEAENVTY